MFKKCVAVLCVLSLFIVTACSHKDKSNVVRVGTIAGPETQLMDVAKAVAKKEFGLHVKVIAFTDYNMPNQALEDKEIDVNAFQHYPFLLSQIKARGYSLVPVGDTFLYPMGLYSQKIKSLTDVKEGDEIAIPNDPSNEARALLLLQKAGLITLKPNITINATIEDVVGNPKKLKLTALDAAQLPRVLDDVTIAAINTNYALPAGLSPAKALLEESTDSPYMNIIVARAADKNTKKIKELVEAYQSAPVLAEAKILFGDSAIAGFKITTAR
ncbi:MAG: D-methionine ABC transporter, periplasmic D-methionine-binding protein [uncultured bacterium]|nr:MAG: D-methionine ABC transporter, periplasmic D-methionine-binding protein [uncultured bacterium]OGT25763.1 MAG: hypothetical protein A3B71_01340 [Gammaproteobacteria bacterium RIFCSPHIGHO2_02_FULL_42_43]OGT51711.1 MAG: hypothetical protein A3E54_03555 [Gammaproteobacteria bacterium RIFCSPHIGHO2_12_FULL_41_25]OGT61608.1 MAG: hypothetical protein A3I77_03360 [Gammaproteobacteria bacterium RIFCSPLOWO2_02_FULL_42_14]OGT86232.1 MAG: hypothetical protein A3G86_06210 [Gammaproteobacteria bacteriu